jgi:hypothetical protein
MSEILQPLPGVQEGPAAEAPKVEIPAFTSHKWLAYVACDKERPRDNTGLPGTVVSIDGKEFTCLDVESHKANTPLAKGESIGLVVKGPRVGNG